MRGDILWTLALAVIGLTLIGGCAFLRCLMGVC